MASPTTKPAAPKRRISSIAASSAIQKDDPVPDIEERLNYIATAAYFRAASRGFVPGEELKDWLAAEAEFDETQGR
jgi:hypothetical protein